MSVWTRGDGFAKGSTDVRLWRIAGAAIETRVNTGETATVVPVVWSQHIADTESPVVTQQSSVPMPPGHGQNETTSVTSVMARRP